MTIRSNQTRGFRVIQTVPVTADGQVFTIDLPRGPHLERVCLRVSGTFAITTTFTAVRAAAAYRYLKRCDFVLNSNVTMDSVSGTQLAQLYVTLRNNPTSTNPSGFGVAAGLTFDAAYYFDRAGLDMVRPKDSMLKTDVGVANLQLRITLGNLSDMFTGAGVATYTSVSLTVSVMDYQEQRAADGSTPSPKFYLKRNGLTQTFAGAATGQLVKLNTGNRLRIVSLIARDGTTFEPNIALISRFGLKRAGDQRVDMPVTDLLRLNSTQYDIGNGLLAGQVLFDFAHSGQSVGCRYSEFWPVPSSADTFLVVDVTGACQLEIATLEGVDLA